jgi:pimeloyl-ACP methyl ester carboxylesterase
VIYCHGFPASRLEAGLVEEAAERAGVRLIAVDRPGYGLSDYQSGRRLEGWPGDVAALADGLGLEHFAVLGVSGGGPYALACARYLSERLTRVGVVCGLGPLAGSGLLREMAWPARFSFSFMQSLPRTAGIFYRGLAGSLFRRFPAMALEVLTVAEPPADAAVLRRPEVKQRLIASLREAFRQGGRGAALELELLGRPWGFDLEQITLPVLLWHGREDRTVPVGQGEYVAARLPDCRTVFPPGEGHFSLPVLHAESILKALR